MLERYEAYKDSGVEWIGEVPEHWGVSKFAFAGTTSLGKMLTPNPETDDDQLLPYLCAANAKESGIVLKQLKEMYFSPKDGDKYTLMCGDLVVVEGGNVGLSHVWTGGEMRIQNALHRFRANEQYVAEYLKYSLDAAKNAGYIDLVCNKATIAHFTSEKLMETPVCCVPLCEQRAIADFLDEKTTEIDSIVSETERSIELLREYRKSVISEAVTKGLDPNAPMKDSGVEWIGEIPAVWDVARMSNFVRFHSGDSLDSTLLKSESPYPVYGGGNVKGRYDQSNISAGSVLVSRQGATCGAARYIASAAWATEHALIATKLCTMDSRWLAYFLGNMNLGQYSMTAAQPGISADKIESLPIVVASTWEQERIADYLDTKTAEIDALIADKERQVELLKEYRKSLISEAVTGKFKVPGVS